VEFVGSDSVNGRIINKNLHMFEIVKFLVINTVESECSVRRLIVNMELYGWTTTSLTSSVFGKTENVLISFFGK